MQQQVKVLENVYAQMCMTKVTQQQMLTGPNSHMDKLMDQYVNAREELEVLRNDSTAMKLRLVEFDRFSSALEGLVSDMGGANMSKTAIRPPTPPSPPPSTADFTPLSEAAIHQIIKDSYDQIFNRKYHGKRMSTELEVFGWKDERYVDATSMQYSLSKHFHHAPMETLMEKTWEIATTVKHMKTIQKSTISLEVLQFINNDTFILRRRVHHAALDTVACADMLMFRFRTDQGYVVAYTALQNPAAAKQSESIDGKEPKVRWVKMLQWFTFERGDEPRSPEMEAKQQAIWDGWSAAIPSIDQTAPPEEYYTDCKVTFGGSLDNTDPAYVSFFLVEVVSIIFRWEQQVTSRRLMFHVS